STMIYSSGDIERLVVAGKNGIYSYEITTTSVGVTTLSNNHSIITGDWSISHITALSNHKYAVYTKDKLQIISSKKALTDKTKFMEKLSLEISITSSKLSLGIQIGDFFVIPTHDGLKLINIEKQIVSTFTAEEIVGAIDGAKLFHTSIIPTGVGNYRLLFAQGSIIHSVVFNPLNFIERINVVDGSKTVTSDHLKIVFQNNNQAGKKTWTVSGHPFSTDINANGEITGYKKAPDVITKKDIQDYLASLITGTHPKISIPAHTIANVAKGLYATGTVGDNDIEIPFLDKDKHKIKVTTTFTWTVNEKTGIVTWTAQIPGRDSTLPELTGDLSPFKKVQDAITNQEIIEKIRSLLSVASIPKSQLPSRFKTDNENKIKTLNIQHAGSNVAVKVTIVLTAKDNYGKLIITSTVEGRQKQLPSITLSEFRNTASTITEQQIKVVVNPLLSSDKVTISTDKQIQMLPSFVMVGSSVVSLTYGSNTQTGDIRVQASVIGSTNNFSWVIHGYKKSYDTFVGKSINELLGIFGKHLLAQKPTIATLNKGRLPSQVPDSELLSAVSLDENIGATPSGLTGLVTGSKSFFVTTNEYLIVDPSGSLKLASVGSATTTFSSITGSYKVQLVKYIDNNKFAIFTSDSNFPLAIDHVAYMTYDPSAHSVSISAELSLPSSLSSVMEVNVNTFVGIDANGKTQLFKLDPTDESKAITFRDISTTPNNHPFASQIVYQNENIVLLKDISGDLFVGRFDSISEEYIATGKSLSNLDGTIIPVKGTTELFVVENGKLTLVDIHGGNDKRTPTKIGSLSNNLFKKDINPQDIIKFNNNQYGFIIGGKLYEVDITSKGIVFANVLNGVAKELVSGITGHVSIQTGDHEYLIGDSLQKVSIDRGSLGEFANVQIVRENFDKGATGHSRGYMTLSITFNTPSGAIKTITKVIDGFKQKIEADQSALINGYTFGSNTKTLTIDKVATFTLPANLKVMFAVIDPSNKNKPVIDWLDKDAFIAALGARTSGEIDRSWIKMKYEAKDNAHYVFANTASTNNLYENAETGNVLNFIFNEDVQNLLQYIGVTGDTAHAAFSDIDSKLFKAALELRHM
ncbi:MAG: hypothetical protein KAG14_03645, partial [Mycoplasmataceae bacterium]|nr:hypothetical protein [Mycoplasmataceae bacterium]